ncbi:hypothetical protein BS47DRAFT_1339211 [Hydnum rufescens UP504]|uniref:Uncharacterized protein n=1 Tax=Hydnum rufescens UP504 TaxID=1448309 RepID=A0A9P6B7G8_9AGAM|nr:hypothetical protein BS47DRAFT_1339211 [Hydnum rufescens UP504]
MVLNAAVRSSTHDCAPLASVLIAYTGLLFLFFWDHYVYLGLAYTSVISAMAVAQARIIEE